MKKRNGRISVVLEPGEACVVMEKKFWDHMVDVYSIMSQDTHNSTEKEYWLSVIAEVKRWVDQTHYEEEEEEYYEWG